MTVGPRAVRAIESRTAVVVLFAIIVACRSSGSSADIPKPVFVPQGARELRVGQGVATGQVDVSYLVEAKYPAPDLREALARTLRASGYQVLDHDFLDPGTRIDGPRDWASYVDATLRPATCVRELVEDWQNLQGDVVRYSLRYDSPCEAGPVRRMMPTNETLRVTAAVIPAETARATREALESFSRQRK
jgi:hypothetical protein